MENASKALLIAGSILIVILLIAVGMLIYSRARSVVDTGIAQMSSTEISLFNARFNEYSGSQKGTSVRALLQEIIANNETNKSDPAKQVHVKATTVYASADNTVKQNIISNTISAVKPSTTYTVTFEYTDSLITSVTIK